MEPSAQLEVNHLRNKSNWWWSSMKSLAGLKIPSSNKILLGLKRALFHTKVQFSNESRHPKRMNCCRVSMGTVDCREDTKPVQWMWLMWSHRSKWNQFSQPWVKGHQVTLGRREGNLLVLSNDSMSDWAFNINSLTEPLGKPGKVGGIHLILQMMKLWFSKVNQPAPDHTTRTACLTQRLFLFHNPLSQTTVEE